MIRVRVATVNDDFTDRKTNIPLVAPYADVILTQENKDDNVRRLVPKGWSVHQVMKTPSTRGSAVCWREGKPFRMGSTDQKYAVGSHGFKLTPRRLTIVHGRVGTTPVTFIATHRPPGRMKLLWKRYDKALTKYIRLLHSKGRKVVVGLDANQKNPATLASSSGTRWVAPNKSIDGFLVSPGITLHRPKNLPKWTSDHHPVLLYLDFPQEGPSKPAEGTIKPEPKEAKVATSQNGWPVLGSSSSKLHTWVIPAKNGKRKLRLRNGSAGFLLAYHALWFSEKMEDITAQGLLDDWGYAYRPVRGQSSGYSNHASGTAMDLNATWHPLGKRKTRIFRFSRRVDEMRRRLRWMKNVLRWGGDYQNRADEMHFEINVGLREAEREARRLMKTPRGRRLLKANPGQKKVILS